ncbi:hypothetical protein [Gracilimonas sp.]|uniref:hypothetical protein n=1 Tax=Gracilimonas sp. TaxID=1974203 RepID=UPI002870C2F4|nr:hypothetical protein [Gracilimonas sp.]
MEPTRVGSFDNQMYMKLDAGLYYVSVEKRLLTNEIWEMELEKAEKQITDSHDITKSSFGFNP